jgi:hypothetical protein
VDLITHAKPTQGPDFYNRLDMLWEGLCAAVAAIDPSAWGAAPSSPKERVTAEVTVRVTAAARQNEKPSTTQEVVGGQMEREKGFEWFRRRVNYSKQDAPLPFIAAEPFAFSVPSRSTWSRPVPALGAAAGHMWGT